MSVPTAVKRGQKNARRERTQYHFTDGFLQDLQGEVTNCRACNQQTARSADRNVARSGRGADDSKQYFPTNWQVTCTSRRLDLAALNLSKSQFEDKKEPASESGRYKTTIKIRT